MGREENSKNWFQMLDWDSNLFGYKVAKIIASYLTSKKLKKILSELLGKNFSLVYWFVNPTDEISNKAAEANGGFLADERVTYALNLSQYSPPKLNYQNLQSYLGNPLNKRLTSLALQSGFYSRFRRDRNFKHNEFNKLYTTWIEKSLKGEIATDIIVYIDNNVEKGLITLESKHGFGNIGLLAVDKKYQHQSIGKKLVNTALLKFKGLGCSQVKVVTQKKNIAACKFYEKIGFVQENIQNVYHFWL